MLRRVPRAIRFGLTAAFLVAALSACTAGERAEALYLHQHRLLAALTTTIDAVEPDDPDLAERLYDSEDELNAACRALWEAGARRVEAREIGDGLRWQVFTILESCAEKPARSRPRSGGWTPIPPRSTWAGRSTAEGSRARPARAGFRAALAGGMVLFTRYAPEPPKEVGAA